MLSIIIVLQSLKYVTMLQARMLQDNHHEDNLQLN